MGTEVRQIRDEAGDGGAGEGGGARAAGREVAAGAPPLVRGGFARTGLALLAAGVGAAVVSLLAQAVVNRVGASWLTSAGPHPSFAGEALTTALIVTVVAAALGVCVRRRWWRGTQAVAV